MNLSVVRKDIVRWMEEDIQSWDNSSILLQPQQVSAKIYAKQDGVVSGTSVAQLVFEMNNVVMKKVVAEGNTVQKGDILCELQGLSTDILQAERTALNIFSHMSGISTITSQLVTTMREINPKIIIAATRKTLPGLRRYQKWAVHVAGGDTHRMSLSSMIMFKENHLANFESITQAIQQAKKNSSFSIKLEVEVRNDDEAIEAANAGADIIMLDNYTPEMIGGIINQIREIDRKILVEASGNINEKTIGSYVQSGVDIISMGKLTHSSQVFDMSLIFDNLN